MEIKASLPTTSTVPVASAGKTAQAAFTDAQALLALTALAHAQRLRVFRALVQAGMSGLQPGTLALMLDVPPSSLSFHLKELAHAQLVSVEQQGRHLIYRANYAQMNQLLGFLTENCCAADPLGGQHDCC